MPERKYNEAELAAILRTAAEAQSAGPTSAKKTLATVLPTSSVWAQK